jgi:beta-glucosidase
MASHPGRFRLPFLILALIAAARGLADSPPAFRDPDLPTGRRIEDLISRMTVDEKIGQLMMTSPGIPRLGIADYDWWNEALHGVARNGIATVFPQAIALAATWNPVLHGRIAEVISTEARAKNNVVVARTGGASQRYEGLTIWSPNINIFRDPRWGRGQETYGEDPFLTSRYAVAFVRGLQGDDPRYLKAVATLKHFAVHSGPEELRHRFDAVVSERDLHETYLPAFEAGIREGGARSVMSAYNAIDGIPAPANVRLLTKILRDDWGFTGAVVGDVDTVADIWRPASHNYAPDAAHASALALKAGTDLCSGRTYEALPEALKDGLLTEADLDVALRRIFQLRFQLGQFDPPARVPYTSIPISENDSPAHNQLALDAARQSMVLLENDGTLPLDVHKIRTLALIGPTADSQSAMLGNYCGTPATPVTLLSALRAKLEPLGIEVLTATGARIAKGYREYAQPFPDGTVYADEKRTIPGLAGSVFANPVLEGTAVARRTDGQVDFKWNSYHPVPGIPVQNASVSWTGWLVPPATGDYDLGLVFAGGARLYVDDSLVIDSWAPGPHRSMKAKVPFAAGQARRVRLDYSQTSAADNGRAEIVFGWKPPGGTHELETAMAAARKADCIVLALGLTPDIEGEEMHVDAEGFEGGDRTSVRLAQPQAELLEKVSELGKPVVVVLTTGSAISFDVARANAALVAWYYGERGGDAVAEALLGETNPSGKLPVTFYASDSDLPPFTDYSMKGRTYRYFPGKPLFAFGHGLSYTTFKFEKMDLSSPIAGAGDTVVARVTVDNTGKREGDEVVELYAHAEHPPVEMPIESLVGFQRVSLKAGESKTVEITLPLKRLRRWDEAGQRYVVDPGAYELRAGPASDVAALTAPLTVN